MITDLESAIKHYEEVAEKLERVLNYYKEHDMPEYINTCSEFASEQRQLAEWLKALKEIWDSGDCNDCGNRGCLYKPRVGRLVRYNCPFYSKEVKNES